MSKRQSAVERVIEAMGSQQLLAAGLGIKAPSISEWKARGVIPVRRVLDIERLTGIPRHELRPDLYRRLRSAA